MFLHVLLGALFSIGALLHLRNNLLSLMKYLSRLKNRIGLGTASVFIILVWLLIPPFDSMLNAYLKFKSKQPHSNSSGNTIYELDVNPDLSLVVKSGNHFWFPQIAVWVEDTTGRYIKTLFVTNSTAKGHFLGGRTKENFKDIDGSGLKINNEFRRVNALPYWSHARGIIAEDGLYAPTINSPLPDGISGATPNGSFELRTNFFTQKKYIVKLEVNVAFDDNRYYSEYDYPEDSLYHSGTGLLGQPSVVYSTFVDRNNENYLFSYTGHTYPSGTSQYLFKDKEGLTTALEIIDYAILQVGKSNDNTKSLSYTH